jgi:signal peptidase II
LKKLLADYGLLFAIAGIVILLDQLTKHLVRANLPLGAVLMPDLWLSQYARIVHWQNTGITLGMFQNMGNISKLFPIVIGLGVLFIYPRVPREEWPARLALGLMLGGGLGNLIDRLILGHVTDFISIWVLPVLNLADASIMLGTTILIFWMLKKERRNE